MKRSPIQLILSCWWSGAAFISFKPQRHLGGNFQWSPWGRLNALRGRFSAESGTEGVGLGSCLAVLPCLLGSLANEVDEGAPEGGARRRLAASNHFRDLPGKLRYFFFFFLRRNFFFFKFIYLFIYLFLVVLGLRFCARALSSCGKRGPLLIAVHGPLTIAASRCGAQAPDAQAQ